MKSSRSNLPQSVGLPPSYDAFFSFPVRKHGYSGVATYTRRSSVVPLKAEEGLCGIVQPKPPLNPKERVSGPAAYPQRVIEEEEDDDSEGGENMVPVTPDYKDIDSEGRVLVLDFGLFVLVNVYCPNDGIGTPERDKYNSDFRRVLKARVQGLVEHEKREVIVVGDLNACAAVIDHCEGHLMVARGHVEGLAGEEGFWGKDARRWLREWLVNDNPDAAHSPSSGCLVDIVRRLYPDRKGMYTCTFLPFSVRRSFMRSTP